MSDSVLTDPSPQLQPHLFLYFFAVLHQPLLSQYKHTSASDHNSNSSR